MTTTVQQIVLGAYAKSAKNRPLSIATDATELVEVVTRAIRGLYSYAARVNPLFFAQAADVGFLSGGWLRPANAESLFWIERVSDGAEVVVVPFDDRKAEPSKPAVYELGQVFQPAGNPGDPSTMLRFFFSRRPVSLTSLADTLDPSWPETFNELLMDEVAIYLALKDGRMDEVATLRPLRDAWADLFSAFLEHATVNERRRFGQVRRFNSNALVPLKAILA